MPTYTHFIPPNKHIKSKAHTHIIEGENTRIRLFLPRFHRKTFCYSKSLEMTNYSIKLLNHKKALNIYQALNIYNYVAMPKKRTNAGFG